MGGWIHCFSGTQEMEPCRRQTRHDGGGSTGGRSVPAAVSENFDVPGSGGEPAKLEPVNRAISGVPDRILLGVASPGARRVYWEFWHKDLNNRHILIFGSSGMGKTYTIQCLLFEMGRSGQNSLIVDYTNGFFDKQLEREFTNLLRPVQHVVRREPLAINPFRQQAEVIG